MNLVPRTTHDEARDYLLTMIAQLAKLARGSGEAEVEILLNAALATAQLKKRDTARKRANTG